MDPMEIFKPMMVQAGLMVAVGYWLVWARIGSLIRGKINRADVAENGWPGWIKQAGDNFSNQFELPLLFFTLCFTLFLTNAVSSLAVMMAWVFAVSRIFHALIHLSKNIIMLRFLVFFVGVIALTVLCILSARAVF